MRAREAGAHAHIRRRSRMAELPSRPAATRRRTPTAITVSPHVTTAHVDLNLNTEVARVGQPRVQVRLTSTEWAIVLYLVPSND